AAEAGDVSAANALLDRVAPKLRPAACTFEVSVTGSQTELGQRLLGAVGRGQIAASDAAEILDLADRSAPSSSTIETIDYAALDEMYEQALQKAKEDDARMAHRRSESPPESKAPPTVNTEGVTST
ncbi:hypothetical protein, partial [Thiocystis violacea]|uniref:hypothetical protein n=1 Tax=Thiocystis violacea TaxID=13725 RepID=UPI001A939697